MMDVPRLSRREALVHASRTLALLAFFDSPLFAWGREGETTVPFLDQPPAPPPELLEAIGFDLQLLDWQKLDSWLTPAERFFRIAHHGVPRIDAKDYRLEISGLVENPGTYTLEEIKALPKQEVVFALECSGNSGFAWFQGGIGNARWGGTPLAAVLQKAAVKKGGIEIVFFGYDEGEVTVPYIDGMGGKVDEFMTRQSFARSMSLADAMHADNLLCYEINGRPLPPENGFPLRLIAPGWYGIANVKWLKRIDVIDTRFMGLYMAERYVTVREEERGGEVVWARTSVGPSRLKSMAAKVTVKDERHRIYGAAWGARVARVEVQVDQGAWTPAVIDEGQGHDFAWKFWHLEWPNASPGEHTVTSRAIDAEGNVQPAMTDPAIARKRTYWEANGQITRRIRI